MCDNDGKNLELDFHEALKELQEEGHIEGE